MIRLEFVVEELAMEDVAAANGERVVRSSCSEKLTWVSSIAPVSPAKPYNGKEDGPDRFTLALALALAEGGPISVKPGGETEEEEADDDSVFGLVTAELPGLRPLEAEEDV